MSNKYIVVNQNGVNTLLSQKPISRLYCGYQDNNVNTGGVQDTWYTFSNPVGGVTIYRNQDWEIVPNTVSFKYIGTTTKWFNIHACCNVLKDAGGGASRSLEFQWDLNGTLVGGIRRTHMNNQDAQIVSGEGQIQLSTDDVITPKVRNIENNDPIILFNCTFDIKEDYELTWFE